MKSKFSFNKSNKYPLKSAGRKIIKNVPICHQNNSVLDVKNMLFGTMDLLETINYIYVVDKQRKLIGVFSIKDIFRQSDDKKIKEIMSREVVKIKPYANQEKVAILALQNNVKSVPVVDKNNKFLGIVPSDIILDILHSENVEDFLKMAGINSSLQKMSKGSVFYSVKMRIPWLILGLLGGVLAAKITTFFETPLKAHFLLASFIPLIVYTADAVGTQTQTLYIRNLALDQFSQIKYFFKEIRVSIFIAFSLAILFFLISSFLSGDVRIGFISGISLFFTIIMAVASAILIPWILQRLKKDPALGSGPFATIIADISSLIIYFFITTFLLNFFAL